MVRDLSKNHELIMEAKNVTKKFAVSGGNSLTACDNINLSMFRGKTLGIVGESGCGKSTFLRMLMNLEKTTSGEIYYKGKNINKFSKNEIWESRQHIQMVYQDPGASFNPRMKVVDILTEPLINYGRLKKEDKVILIMNAENLFSTDDQRLVSYLLTKGIGQNRKLVVVVNKIDAILLSEEDTISEILNKTKKFLELNKINNYEVYVYSAIYYKLKRDEKVLDKKEKRKLEELESFIDEKIKKDLERHKKKILF